ncbi:MAG: hypothetical protein CL799_11015 [Chromatiales bacterium]|jgi:membrane protease YdiL (CAAX protease family)|nr:hypothetical protein [Chromatiales bacterium]
MNSEQWKTSIWAIVLGLIFFGVVMGLCIGLVTFNTNWTPDVVWFPLPATIVLIGSTWWAQRKWDIGLRSPANVQWSRVYVIGIGLTVLGVATAVVQGKFTGMVRATELMDAEVSDLFKMTYAFYMSVLAAILAEVTFRGIVQTRMQSVLSIWPTVFIIGVVNVLAHRWGPELLLNWLGLFVTLAGWTYLRWLCQSLWPPLILHAVTNFLVALGLYTNGPLVHAELANGVVLAVGITGLAGLLIAALLARNIRPAH